MFLSVHCGFLSSVLFFKPQLVGGKKFSGRANISQGDVWGNVRGMPARFWESIFGRNDTHRKMFERMSEYVLVYISVTSDLDL